MTGAGPEALPLVNWLFWSAVTAGTAGVVGVTGVMGGTTRGYQLFMAFVIVALAGIFLLSEMGLPDAGWGVRRGLVIACGAGCLVYLVSSLARLPGNPLALLAAVLGVAAATALIAETVLRSAGTVVSVLFASQVVIATVALGAALAGMLLGHWYLVTPRLSPAPLRRMMWLLAAALVAQAAAFVAALVIVPAAEALTGSIGWLTWLRLLAGILLPLGITVLAIAASRAPSLQATTGLLYVALALVMAGAIAGPSIAYLTGVPV